MNQANGQASWSLVHCIMVLLVTVSISISSKLAAQSTRQNNKTNPSDRTFEDKSRHFRITIPSGWSVTPVSYSVMHYRDVFLCINSRGNKALRIANKRTDNMETYNPDTVAEQLEPGTVYIDFAFFEGPGGRRNFKGKPDTVGPKSRPFPKKLDPAKVAGGKLSMIELSFINAERRWHVYAYLREPVKDELRAKAMDVLRSFRFVKE